MSAQPSHKLAGQGDHAAGLASTDAGVPQGTVLTRTLYVNITGSLANLSMAGPSGGSWKLVDGKQIGVFGMGTEIDTQVATNQLPTSSRSCRTNPPSPCRSGCPSAACPRTR